MRVMRVCMHSHGASVTFFPTIQITPLSSYVKPPPPVHFSLDAAGYMFFADVDKAMEKYGSDMVNSVMLRAESVYRNFETAVNPLSFYPHCPLIQCLHGYCNGVCAEKCGESSGCGEAKDVICGVVEKLKADTLVMGSHGYGFIKRVLLGSVSDHCAKNVKCPVVIVKHPEEK